MAVDIGTLKGTLTLDDRFSSKLTVAGDKIEQTGKKWEKVGGKLSATGSALNRSVTLPLAAAATGALTLSSQFETSLTKIETLVGIAGEEVAGFRDRVLELSGETARAPKELADALFVVTSAGARGSTALEILERAAKASAAGLGDTNEIARAVTAAVSAYGEENLSASRATDVLVATVREGNLEASELAGSLGRVIGIASQVGVSFEQVGGFVATFTRLGVNAEEAVTSLRGVLAAAIAPTEGAAKGLAELGTSADELRSKIQDDGLDAALRDLVERADGNTEALQKVIPNIRALSGVLGTAGAQGETFSQINENIANSLGILDEAFGRTTETTGFKFQQFLSQLQQVGIRLGDELAPSFEKILAALTDVLVVVAKGIELFASLPQGVQSAVIAVTALAAALGPLLSIFGSLFTVGGKLLTLFGGGLKLSAVGTAASAATTGVTTLTSAFAGLSIGILGPAGVVAAIALFSVKIAEASADAEEAAFKLAEINGKIVENALAVNDLREAFRSAGEEGLRAYLDSLDPAVVKSTEFSTKLSDLRNSGRITQEEFIAISNTVAGYRSELETTVPATETFAQATTEAVQPVLDLDQALQDFGFVTISSVNGELETLAGVVDAGIVPTEQLRAKVEELEATYKELGLITPEVRTKLDEITAAINEQDVAVDGIIGTVPEATNALDLFGGTLEGLPGVLQATGDSAEDALTRWAAASDANAFALGELIAQQQGLTSEQGLALTAYRDNEEQLLLLASRLRGEYGPAIQESTERMLGLTEATEGGTFTSGNLFSKLTEGIPIIGDLGSSLDGLFNKLGGIFSGDGILGKIGSFFGGGGGEGGGGFFNSIVSGLTGALGGGGSKVASVFSGLLGTGLSAAFGPLGGLVSAGITKLGGLAIKGITALGKKIGGFFKGLFGGPDAAELEARKIGNSLQPLFNSILDSQQRNEAAGRDWAAANIAIRDSFLAVGLSEQAAADAATRLSESVRRGPAEAQAAVDALTPIFDKVQAALDSTGLGLTELRNKAINESNRLGITVAEAFEAIANGTIDTMKKTEAAVETSTSANVETVVSGAVAATTGATEAVAKGIADQQQLVADSTQATVDQFKTLEETATTSAGRVQEAFENVDITVPIRFDVDDVDLGDFDRGGEDRGAEEFQGGTGPGGMFRNFGRGTRAILHGDEAVVTRGQGESIAAMVERAIGAGGGAMQAMGPQVIRLEVDGQVLTEVVLRNQSRVLSNKGLGLG